MEMVRGPRAGGGFVGCGAAGGFAAGEANVTASPVTQNFDSIGASATATLPTGFKMTAAGGGNTATWTQHGSRLATTIAQSNGTGATGRRINWAPQAGGTDQAIGFMTSGSYASAMSSSRGSPTTPATRSRRSWAAPLLRRYRTNTTAWTNAISFSTDGKTWGASLYSNVWAASAARSGYGYPMSSSAANFTVASQSVAPGGTFYLRIFMGSSGSSNQGVGLDDLSLTLQYAPTAVAPTLTSPTATAIGQAVATLGANLTADGGDAITERGTVWGTSANPTGNGAAEGGTTTDVFAHERTSLSQGTNVLSRLCDQLHRHGLFHQTAASIRNRAKAGGLAFNGVGSTT